MLLSLNSWQVLEESLNQGKTCTFLPHTREFEIRPIFFCCFWKKKKVLAFLSSVPVLSSYSKNTSSKIIKSSHYLRSWETTTQVKTKREAHGYDQLQERDGGFLHPVIRSDSEVKDFRSCCCFSNSSSRSGTSTLRLCWTSLSVPVDASNKQVGALAPLHHGAVRAALQAGDAF